MDEIKFEISVLGARLVEIPDRVLSRDELRALVRAAEDARAKVWQMRREQGPAIIRVRDGAAEQDVAEALANDPGGVFFQWPMSLEAYDWLAEHPGHPFEIVEVPS